MVGKRPRQPARGKGRSNKLRITTAPQVRMTRSRDGGSSTADSEELQDVVNDLVEDAIEDANDTTFGGRIEADVTDYTASPFCIDLTNADSPNADHERTESPVVFLERSQPPTTTGSVVITTTTTADNSATPATKVRQQLRAKETENQMLAQEVSKLKRRLADSASTAGEAPEPPEWLRKKPVENSAPLKPSVSCPVCLDDYDAIVSSGRKLQSTACGHVCCDECAKTLLATRPSFCPQCRKPLTKAKVFALYL